MISKTCTTKILFVLLIAVLLATGPAFAREPEAFFPTFGSGTVEVRLYTDYFCPPCRALEPEVEPALKRLLNKKAIRLTLVDVPYNPSSPLFARYFLYALAKNRNVEHAIHVRNILFDAAVRRDANTEDQLETLLKSKGISLETRDTKPVFNRYNAMIQGDRIDATPTCVIIRGDKKEKHVGKPDIVNALKRLP